MHLEIEIFFRSLKEEAPEVFKNSKVLEIGSYNVNGSLRSFFEDCNYVGVDLTDGPGVDIVCSGHLFKSDHLFDVSISSECFEHNPFYKETFQNMTNLTREGGVVAFTCAATGRPEHGTTRTLIEDSPGTTSLNWDYYKNLEELDFDKTFIMHEFEHYIFLKNTINFDLMFIGIKRGGPGVFQKSKWEVLERNVRYKIQLHHYHQIFQFLKLRSGDHEKQVDNLTNIQFSNLRAMIVNQNKKLSDISRFNFSYWISTFLRFILNK